MRNISLDNFKTILIGLVVIGHVIEPLKGKHEWVNEIYIFIYLFHMPMFAYVSGIFSSSKINDEVFTKIIKNLIIPYILFELAYSIFVYFVFSKASFKFTPLVPYWIMWYLFSLILWRLALPIFKQLKYPVIIAFIAGLVVGTNKYGHNLSFSRTFVFLPFFLLGHFHHRTIITELVNFRLTPIIGLTVLTSILLVVLLTPTFENMSVRWLYGSTSYAELNVGLLQGILNRSGLYILAIILGISSLVLASSKENFATRFGENTLYIYLLHGFIMKAMIAIGIYKPINEWWEICILATASLLLLPILSSKPCRIISDTVSNPLNIADAILKSRPKI